MYALGPDDENAQEKNKLQKLGVFSRGDARLRWAAQWAQSS